MAYKKPADQKDIKSVLKKTASVVSTESSGQRGHGPVSQGN